MTTDTPPALTAMDDVPVFIPQAQVSAALRTMGIDPTKAARVSIDWTKGVTVVFWRKAMDGSMYVLPDDDPIALAEQTLTIPFRPEST